MLRLPEPVGLKGIINETMEDASDSLGRPVIKNGARFSGYAIPSYEQDALPAVWEVW